MGIIKLNPILEVSVTRERWRLEKNYKDNEMRFIYGDQRDGKLFETLTNRGYKFATLGNSRGGLGKIISCGSAYIIRNCRVQKFLYKNLIVLGVAQTRNRKYAGYIKEIVKKYPDKITPSLQDRYNKIKKGG